MKKKLCKKIIAILTIVCMLVAFTACTSESQKQNSASATQSQEVKQSPETNSASAQPIETKSPSASGKKLKFGVSTNALANLHNRHMFESVIKEVEKAGHEVVQVNANGDAAQQSMDIENLVQAGCNVIVVQNGDAFSLKNAVQEASKAGIYVISQDSGWMDGCSALFTLNSFKVGADIYMMLAGETGFAGKIITTGHQDNFALRSIGALQQDFVKEYSGLKIVAHVQTTFPGTTEVTYNGLESALLANPDVAAIWTSQDLEAMGAIQALKEANLYPKVKCVGVDGELDVLKDIKAGGSVLCTVISDLDGCAVNIVKYGERLCAGEKLPKAVDIPYSVVTADNVDEFIKKAEEDQVKYAEK